MVYNLAYSKSPYKVFIVIKKKKIEIYVIMRRAKKDGRPTSKVSVMAMRTVI